MKKPKPSFPKNKQIFFLAGFPRAGNTLLTSILNQNPDIGCTPNSIVLEIYKAVFTLREDEVFKNYPNHQSLDNVLEAIIPAYYKNWNYKYILDRGPAGTDGNLPLLQRYFKQEIKIIFLVRPILEVLASFISWSRREPTSYINRYDKSITEKCDALMHPDLQIVKELRCMHHLLKPENKHHVLFIDYKEIVNEPQSTMKAIYKFLGIPPFKHRFINLDQVKVNGLAYDDTVIGNNLHTIKTKRLIKSNTVVKKILPSNVIQKYGGIQFI